MEAAAKTLAEASRAGGDDTEELAEVNRAITEYTGLVEAARANNRQGFPVGAAYLRAARSSLQDEALPRLQKLVDEGVANANSASAGEDAQRELWLLLGIVLVALLAIQAWLFLRTRRIINPPLAGATALVLLLGLAASAVVAWSSDTETDARADPYVRTVALATARVNAFDAKSEEAVTLIARGADTGAEGRYQVSIATAFAALGTDESGNDEVVFDSADRIDVAEEESATVRALAAYNTEHAAVRNLDDTGKYDDAVARATGTGEANVRFTDFDNVSGVALEERSEQLSDDLDRASIPLIPLAWILLVAGAVAAIAASRGIAQRLREYR
jgi:hypothetical protein